MSAPQFFYPMHAATILIKGHNQLMNIDDMLGVMKVPTNEIIMRRKQFDIVVEQNRGKSLNLTYDNRKIFHPMVAYNEVCVIDTLPFGHIDLGLYDLYELTAPTMELVCEEDL